MPRAVLALLALGATACNLSSINGSQALPSGTVDPNSFHTPAGAMALYEGAIYTFQYSPASVTSSSGTASVTTNGAFVDYMLTSGVISDELQAGNLGGPPSSYYPDGAVFTDSLDARVLPDGQNSPGVYSGLQGVRASASEAIGALTAWDPGSPPALRGQLMVLRGYAEIMLADLFCSGVPLSTLDFAGDYTYKPGSTTSQVYQAAIAQFDSAITLVSDSVRVLDLARVGKGRALLDLGQFANAAQAVSAVPDNFVYQFPVDWSGGSVDGKSIFSMAVTTGATVADQEGTNGLPFRSSGDPRSASAPSPTGPNTYGQPQYSPVKYGGGVLGVYPITVADGIEARLIEAEAALQAGDNATWLSKLNHARSLAADTLPALTDPGSDTARVSLTFSERAYDLFLTGHRQGDLRRLVRQYHRPQNTVYPVGRYPSAVPGYGSNTNTPLPHAELNNPYFHGCLDRGA